MWEANVTFKREEREGIVPVGSYLSDAAGRLGVRREQKCIPFENIHFCQVTILEGRELLSPQTSHEAEYLAGEENENSEHGRLGCQTRIAEAGDIVIMTTQTPEEQTKEQAEAAGKEYVKEFSELPLEKKVQQLVQLEAIALGETVSYIFNSPFMIFDKAVDIMATFGLKKEEHDRRASRPAEHNQEKDAAVPDDEATEEAVAAD